MSKHLLLLPIIAISWASLAADNPVDSATKILDTDIAKFQQDLANNADKPTLTVDKRKIKADQSALKVARKNQLDWFAKHQQPSD